MEKKEKKRILLTGWSGQVGWEILKATTSKDFDAYVTASSDCQPDLFEIHIAGLEADTTASAFKAVKESHNLNLSDGHAISTLVKRIQPHAIVNAAAYTAVDKAETERETALAVNGLAPRVLASEAKALRAALIHYSTDYVYDGGGESSRTESASTAPLNFYGESKLVGEQGITAELENLCPFAIFRTAWVFSDRGINFVKTMLKLGKERQELRIVADQIGSPTSARMLAEVSWRTLGRFLNLQPINQPQNSSMPWGIYHATCSETVSWHGFALEIFRQARQMGMHLAVEAERVVPISSEDFPTPAKRPRNSRLDCSRLEKALEMSLPSWKTELVPVVQSLCK